MKPAPFMTVYCINYNNNGDYEDNDRGVSLIVQTQADAERALELIRNQDKETFEAEFDLNVKHYLGIASHFLLGKYSHYTFDYDWRVVYGQGKPQ